MLRTMWPTQVCERLTYWAAATDVSFRFRVQPALRLSD